MIPTMKNQLPVFKNNELKQFAYYCDERFSLIDKNFCNAELRFLAIENRLDDHDKKLGIIMETLAEILEKINHLVDVFGKTRADVVDLQYRVSKLELK